MKRKILSLILVFAMTVSLFTVGTGAVEPSYRDIGGHWAEATIESFSSLGLIEGYNGEFFPNKNITRGEMAVILDRLMDYQTAAKNSFSDLGEAFYTDAVLKVNAAGVMLGSDGSVRPTDAITRQEAAVLLCRALGLEGSGAVTQFSDCAQIAPWASDAVGLMAAKGLIQGSDGLFRPTEAITRAETVTILDRALGKLVSAGESATGKVDGTVVVRGAGAKLSGMTINGDLIISEGVGDGEVQLDDVTISGRTIVRGGGEHSIYMNNVRANGGVIVNKLDSRVRIVTSGNTTVSVTVLQTGAILVGDGFETVEIPADVAAGMTVELEGNIDRLVNNSEDVKITANGTIQTVEANAKTEISGKGEVVRATGSADVSLNGNDVPKASGSGSGSGSSGGGSTPAPTVYSVSLDTNVITLSKDSTRQLTAATAPAGLAVAWTSSNAGVAAVDSTGLVTAVSAGTATVTASILDGAYTAACTVTVTDGSTPAPTVYSISLDANVITINKDGTRQLTAATEPAGLAVAWTSSNAGVAAVSGTGLVTAVSAGTATVTASILDGAYTAECAVTVKESEIGWGEATGTDSRFADGYPICTTTDGQIVIKVKAPEASESNPVEVYMIVNQINSDMEASVTSVLHGHSGNRDNTIWVDAAPYLKLTDGEEHTIETGVAVYGDSDIRVDFALKDAAGTSDAVTTVTYTAALVAEVDEVPPTIMSAYLNAARDTIYLHIQDALDTASVPDASAFALTGVEGASVSAVQLTQHDDVKDWSKNRYYFVKLSVSGIAADADISDLEVSYTKPDQNPIQDMATVPNAMEDDRLQVKAAGITLDAENVQVSSDGQYIYFMTTNSDYFITNADSFKVTVKNAAAEEISYTSSWTFSNNGADAQCWMVHKSGPSLSAGETVTLTLTPSEGMVDYAMDPVTEAITAIGTAAEASMQISSAAYDASKQRLTVMIGGAPIQGSIYACSFQLIDAEGNAYTLRGRASVRTNESGVRDRLVFSAGNMPVAPQDGWQLRYEVQHAKASSHSILTEPSGKPMAAQTVGITMA